MEVESDEQGFSPSESSESEDESYASEEEDLISDEEPLNELEASSTNSSDQKKSKNVDALLRGNLVVRRQSLLPRFISVTEGASICRNPFKPPHKDGYNNGNGLLARRLLARKRFVPWGSSKPFYIAMSNPSTASCTEGNAEVMESVSLLPGIDPLVLWQPDMSDVAVSLIPIVVDPLLVKFLRPHQREGVQFMFDCVSGFYAGADINGCILADDMGLGKTLQSITLLYTLLYQGFDKKPMVKKAIVVTPTSLVSNWEAEIKKWVGDRVKLMALCENTRSDVVCGIDNFTSSRTSLQVLIISYETFRMHSSRFCHEECCGLLICDEAHRLKNDQTLTNRALAALSCKRRILLSGTPMQNDLEEFFAMVNFCNPGILGDAAYFRHYYEMPIICGREPGATEEEKKLGVERSGELSAKVNQFILRRTNTLLSDHLPPKIIEVVCCKLSPLQSELYNQFIHSKNLKRVLAEETKKSRILAYITALKKLCNHPKLIYDTIKTENSGILGLDSLRFFPSEMFSGRSGSWSGGNGAWIELSGKMHVLARLLGHLRQKTNDRIVLVSNYTQTLDLFAQLCRERRYPHLRLDGATSISKRQKLVNQFNDYSKDEFVFLLSSKAGGCGLNLIGANRLVLFDPDWNPANDKQAAARVWRDGQKKRVYIYRFLCTGTIEEKVYQRQMSKEGLQKVIQHEKNDLLLQESFLSMEDLRDLFTFHENLRSEIHDKMSCTRCSSHVHELEKIEEDDDESANIPNLTEDVCDIGGFARIAGCLHKLKLSQMQIGSPQEEDLASWGHHFYPTSVPDAMLQDSSGDEVTFVFTNQVDGKATPIESAPSHGEQQKLKAKGNETTVRLKSRLSLFPRPGGGRSKSATSMKQAPPSSRGPAEPEISAGNQLPLKRTFPCDPPLKRTFPCDPPPQHLS